MNCDYGCGSSAKFKLKNGKNCCSDNSNKCSSIREKNSKSVKSSYKNGKRKTGSCVYSQMSEESKNSMMWNRGKTLISLDNIFCQNSNYNGGYVKSVIIREKLIDYKCSCCGIIDWLEKPLVLELDHINGINTDHSLNNLRFLCLNCHSQTPNFRGRNINTGRKIVSDDDLIAAIKSSKNIRQALLKVGLAAKGENYRRVQELKIKYNI